MGAETARVSAEGAGGKVGCCARGVSEGGESVAEGFGVVESSISAFVASTINEVGRDVGSDVASALVRIVSVSSLMGEASSRSGGVLKPSDSEAGVSNPDSSRVPLLRTVAVSSRTTCPLASGPGSILDFAGEAGCRRWGSGGG